MLTTTCRVRAEFQSCLLELSVLVLPTRLQGPGQRVGWVKDSVGLVTDELVAAVIMIGTLWPQQVRQGLLGGFPEGGSSDTPWAGLREAVSGC